MEKDLNVVEWTFKISIQNVFQLDYQKKTQYMDLPDVWNTQDLPQLQEDPAL